MKQKSKTKIREKQKRAFATEKGWVFFNTAKNNNNKEKIKLHLVYLSEGKFSRKNTTFSNDGDELASEVRAGIMEKALQKWHTNKKQAKQ